MHYCEILANSASSTGHLIYFSQWSLVFLCPGSDYTAKIVDKDTHAEYYLMADSGSNNRWFQNFGDGVVSITYPYNILKILDTVLEYKIKELNL